jgi:uncharacterized protein (DUF2384 family)
MVAASTLKRDMAAKERESRVLGEAVSRAASNWKLTDEQLGQIIGISRTSALRLRNGSFKLKRGEKPFELGQYFVRVFRSLDSIMGSDDVASISWLNSHNIDLDRRPIELMRSITGLFRVADYIDGFRARV